MSSTPDLDAERYRNVIRHLPALLLDLIPCIGVVWRDRRSPVDVDKAAQYWILGAESVRA